MTVDAPVGGAQTPFSLRLEHDLDIEARQFINGWLFKWHSLNIEGRSVDVDAFDGSKIHFGGIAFDNGVQTVYWQSVERYLKKTVQEQFSRWENECADYPREQRERALEQTRAGLWRF